MRNISQLAVVVVCLILGFASAILIGFHASDKWPEFFGALTASLVAAAALIFGAYYQDQLTRKRDERQQSSERVSEAIDLCFWLQHCDAELDFIERALARVLENAEAENDNLIGISGDQFREMISSHFYGELLERTKAASRLPPEISGLITGDLYKTYTMVDRFFILRHASKDYLPSATGLRQYIFVIGSRRKALQADAKLVENHLIQMGALPNWGKLEADG